TMRWLADDTRFARPVRWLMALLGDELLEVKAFGHTATRHSMGHRFLARGTVRVADAARYLAALEEANVIADRVQRERRAAEQVESLARETGGRVVDDPDLMSINSDLVEWPTAFSGRFDARYLELPREVIVTALREHQRFFAVETADGRLLPYFIAARNG